MKQNILVTQKKIKRDSVISGERIRKIYLVVSDLAENLKTKVGFRPVS